jgi:putative addiction module CopG family antidote
MDISINQQNQEHIRRKVESGRYKTPDDVLAKALALLDERDDALADIQAKLDEAAGQSRNGQYTIYDEEGLRELKERIKREGRERNAARNRMTG